MKIEHIAILTKNLELLRSFYERYFGARAGNKYVNAQTGFESYFLMFPESEVRLELMFKPAHKECCSIDEFAGLAHFAFSVGSKEAVDFLTNKIKEDGFVVMSGPRLTGDGYYESCILDPDKNRVEITI